MYLRQFSGLLTLVMALTIDGAPYAAVSDTLRLGDKAPGFVANDQDGNLWKFEDHLGKSYLVIYFYPAAMTSGCTKQACSYRDQKEGFDDLQVEIIGISGDPVRNLKYFQEVDQLNFTLLSDVSGEIATKYGVPVGKGGIITRSINGEEKNLERMVSASRWTFVLDPQGRVVYKDADVNPTEDSRRVIDFIRMIA